MPGAARSSRVPTSQAAGGTGCDLGALMATRLGDVLRFPADGASKIEGSAKQTIDVGAPTACYVGGSLFRRSALLVVAFRAGST